MLLESEQEILSTESMIHKKVHAQIDRNQRTYYLREQLKAIRSELSQSGADPEGEGTDFDAESDEELAEYAERIRKETIGAPKEVREKLMKELRRLSKLPYGSPEGNVLRGYLDIVLEYPWSKRTKDRMEVDAARKILDEDHDGMEKVKERILEYLAVRQLNPDIKNQILCLVGAPGVGKTSIAASVARAMRRKYVRVSLGGIRDESDIRGHRTTYLGSMPGRIMEGIKRAGAMNPVMVLDEVDKLTAGFIGLGSYL